MFFAAFMIMVPKLTAAEDDADAAAGVEIQIVAEEAVDEKGEGESADKQEKSNPGKEKSEQSIYDIRQKVDRAQKERYELLKLLGSIYKATDKVDEATEMYKKALDMEPSDKELLNELLDLYKKGQKWTELIPIYEQFIDKYKGENAEYYQQLIVMYLKTNQNDKAFECLEKYLGEYGGKEDSYIYAANIYLEYSKNEQALKAIENGIAKYPGSFELNRKAADVYVRTENYSKALGYLETAKNLTSANDLKEEIDEQLMALYEKADIIKEIVSKKTEDLNKVESELKDLYIKQAKAKEDAAKNTEAIAIYKKLLLLAPDTPEATLAARKIKELEQKIDNK